MSDWSGTVVVNGSNNTTTVVDLSNQPDSLNSTLLSPAVVAPRIVVDPNANPFLHTVQTYLPLIASATNAPEATFWKPNESQGEVGLLQALSLRASVAHNSHLLLSSRPTEELKRNFSTLYGAQDVVDLTQPQFHYSRTARAVMQLEMVDDNVMLDGRALKTGMRQQLPRLHEDDYYVCVYRDYSAYAIKTFPDAVKNKVSVLRSMVLGGGHAEAKQYVEVYCAVCVGQSAGSILLITASQFAYALELLAHQRMNASIAANSQQSPQLDRSMAEFSASHSSSAFYPSQTTNIGGGSSNSSGLMALNKDSFRSLGPLPSTIAEAVCGMNGGAASAAAAAAAAGGSLPSSQAYVYVAPSPWDWTPSAIERRLNHWIDSQYRSLGRMVFKGTLGVVGFLVVYRLVTQRTLFGSGNRGDGGSSARSRRRGGSHQGYRGSRRDDLHHSEGVIESLMRGLFVTAPQQVLDFAFGNGR